MLRSFRVANHKSIRAEQELVLIPAYDKTRPAVSVAAIFGANASGKSNLVDAIRFFKAAVRESFGRWEPGEGVPRTPFRLDPQAAAEPSVYVVELIVDEIRHVYGVALNDRQVVEEWLYSYPRGRLRKIFERGEESIRFSTTLQNRGRAELVGDLVGDRDNALFLPAAARSGVPEVKAAYEWFTTGLVIMGAASPWHQADLVRRLSVELRDERTGRQVLDLLRLADLGISDLKIEHRMEYPPVPVEAEGERLTTRLLRLRRSFESEPDERAREALADQIMFYEQLIGRELTPRQREELVFLHGEAGSPLAVTEQSAGTLAWLRLLVAALRALRRGSVLVVDEIDSSLHPGLTARLVGLFQDDNANARGAQLIFTTHDATLLGTALGEEVLHRDQIWFVEKSRTDGQTKLFPLTDFHPRKEENTERRYLGGSYGAVPLIGDWDEDVLGVVQGSHK